MDKHSEIHGLSVINFYNWLSYPDLTPQERKLYPRTDFGAWGDRQQGRDMRKDDQGQKMDL